MKGNVHSIFVAVGFEACDWPHRAGGASRCVQRSLESMFSSTGFRRYDGGVQCHWRSNILIRWADSFGERLQKSVPSVLVELNIQLRGHLIRQIEQLASARHRQ